MKRVILFDGVCNFCEKSVQFIIKRDPEGLFQFASLQGEVGQKLLKEHHIPEHNDSFILVQNGKSYSKSSAALRVAKHLNGGWMLLYPLLLIPPLLRDIPYTFIAKNRYRWFGKKVVCLLPSPEVRKRFLD